MPNHEEWLIKARQDVKAARHLLTGEFLDIAVYQTQQCAEKALKAYLVCKNLPLEKTHDLQYLVATCVKYDPSFMILFDRAAHLKPYATKFRYPDDVLLPERTDVDAAIEKATFILEFVENKIADMLSGQRNIFE
jgi:HEPN domain-containing protein